MHSTSTVPFKIAAKSTGIFLRKGRRMACEDPDSQDWGGQCNINVKPQGTDSQLLRWITDEFWVCDPEFRRNLRVFLSTFLCIMQMVSVTVTDSLNQLSGTVKQKHKFKAAVGLYHLGQQDLVHYCKCRCHWAHHS